MSFPNKIAAGNTNIKLTMVEPTIVPAAKPTLPELEDVTETDNSGKVVPNDTINIPITKGDNLKTSESLTAIFTNN